MNEFLFKDLLTEFERSKYLDFFSLLDELWSKEWVKKIDKDKIIKDWISFSYFLVKQKRINSISVLMWLSGSYKLDVNYTKFFLNYLLSTIVSLEAVFIEYFNPLVWDNIRKKHKNFLQSFINTVKKLLDLVTISNLGENTNIKILKDYKFIVDTSNVVSTFVPYGLKLEYKQRKIVLYLLFSGIMFLLWILIIFISGYYDFIITIWQYSINIILLVGITILLLSIKLFFSFLNWYYNISKLLDLYEYFSLMLKLSEFELVGVKSEDNQIELKKIILDNISVLLANVDSVYNKSLNDLSVKLTNF